MPRKTPTPKAGTRKYGTKSRYTEERLRECLDKIKKCVLSQREAAKVYGIPRSTLKNKLKVKHTKEFGRPTTLTEVEETSILSHTIALADLGIPIGMQDVRIIVKKYLDDNQRKVFTFKDNLPGWEWGKLFLERHPCIKVRVAHNITRKRAQVSKEVLEEYFNNLGLEIEGVPPENIYNFDETGFHDIPKKAKLIFRRQCRNPEIIRNSTKSCFTVMFCCNANGEFIPPFIIYKAKQKWSNWLLGAPQNSRMAVTKSGWIDAQTFDEWFERHLLPILKKKHGKKIVIGDNLSSHITSNTLKLCVENDVKFICLVPNSTHLLQPLDVAYFSSLKSNWRKVLGDWRQTKRGKIVNMLPKEVFASLLTKTLEFGKDTQEQNARAGFKACGIHPFNREVVLKKVPDYAKPTHEIQESIGESFKSFIVDIRDSDLGVKKKKNFQMPVVAGKSVSVEEVVAYYEERQRSNVEKREQINTGKKRGRPVGSKNKEKGKKSTKEMQTPIFLTSASSSTPQENSDINISVEATVEVQSVILPNAIDQREMVLDHQNITDNKGISPMEIGTEYVIGEYEVHDGLLQRVEDVNSKKSEEESNIVEKSLQNVCKATSYCIFQIEESLFPGRICKKDGENMKVSVMQKSLQGGWKWPSKPDIVNCSSRNIVKYLEDRQVIKKSGFYQIEDDFLIMEWGD